ncbi:hypothetical protein METP2_01239 [Methanosarcinales archaeon]|nr:hypothetical protein METP2_01239 [Methanosarcinales archaeon]
MDSFSKKCYTPSYYVGTAGTVSSETIKNLSEKSKPQGSQRAQARRASS